MKIMIDIPEKVYRDLQKRSTEIQAEGLILENAVINGAPLPKGCEIEPSSFGYCVSMKDVMGALDFYDDCNQQHFNLENLRNDILALPPVAPHIKCIATVNFSKDDLQEIVIEKVKEIMEAIK